MRILLLMLILLSTLASAQQPTLKVYAGITPGLQYYENETVTGPAFALVDRLMAASGLPYEIHLTNWAQAHRQFNLDPNSLVFSISRTSSRETKYQWLVNLAKLNLGIAQAKNRAAISVSNFNELKQHKLAVVRSTSTHETLLNHGFIENRDFTTVATSKKLVKMAETGMVDFVYYESTLTPIILSMLGYESDFLRPLPIEVPDNTSIYLAAHPEFDSKFADQIKDTHEQLTRVKSYQQLLDNVLPNSEPRFSQ